MKTSLVDVKFYNTLFTNSIDSLLMIIGSSWYRLHHKRQFLRSHEERQIIAVSLAKITSENKAIFAPKPIAWPLILAMIGFWQFKSVLIICLLSRAVFQMNMEYRSFFASNRYHRQQKIQERYPLEWLIQIKIHLKYPQIGWHPLKGQNISSFTHVK